MLGKCLFTSKFKRSLTNALARISILKKQHQVRWSQARSDVVQLLNLGHQESAILRVDHVIREQNLLDALVIIEGYCSLLRERLALVKNSMKCPEELKEAITSLIFAASRYGQLPELQKLSRLFMKIYGKEFINYAVELRNGCGVNPKIAKRLPTRRTTLAARLKVLQEIATEHRIPLQLEGDYSSVNKKIKEKRNSRKQTHPESQKTPRFPEQKLESEVPKAEQKYTNVKQAATAASELAAQAAEAARAAVILSKTRLHDNDSDDSAVPLRKASDHNEDVSSEMQKPWKVGLSVNDPFEASFAEYSMINLTTKESQNDEAGPSNTKAEVEAISSVSSQGMNRMDPDGEKDKRESKVSKHPWLEHHEWGTDKKFSSFMNEFLKYKSGEADRDWSRSTSEGSSRGRRPISVRTRRSATGTLKRNRRP